MVAARAVLAEPLDGRSRRGWHLCGG